MTSGYRSPVIDSYVAHHAYHDGPYSHWWIKVLFGKVPASPKKVAPAPMMEWLLRWSWSHFGKTFDKIASSVAPISHISIILLCFCIFNFSFYFFSFLFCLLPYSFLLILFFFPAPPLSRNSYLFTSVPPTSASGLQRHPVGSPPPPQACTSSLRRR